ncbi:MAG: family 20 glycosylhydrolase, partial [Clostridia bacterium]|nr:family 20 glycosylhydrolase [Clostridia bacterium]
MHLIPKPQNLMVHDGVCNAADVYIAAISPNVSAHTASLYAAAFAKDGSVPLYVNGGDNVYSEAYNLMITPSEVAITASGPRGAFYAYQTLMQLKDDDTFPCVEISDVPSMPYRGFYQDVSRGRIPTMDTLKRLVDRLCALKMNSLQLYVEHTHAFQQYVGINEDLGFYTDEEIRELDAYCRERYVELVPSLSSFGHLHALLDSPKYRHLCELPDHQPTYHNWHERLLHHTIDPSNEESVALITSLIEAYLPLFSSDRFNICCDETFDLCKGRNVGGDVATAYADFVGKLVDVLQGHGKSVMMWSDIVMQHPEVASKLPLDVIYLNWCYDANPRGLRPEVLEDLGRAQIVCPSVSSHKRFVEKIVYGLPNIHAVAEAGYEHGAYGLLITNWGDYGHITADEAMLCGLSYGAAKSWNVEETTLENTEGAIAQHVYRAADTEIFSILKTLGACDEIWFEREGYEMALWELAVQLFDDEHRPPVDYDYRIGVLQKNDLRGKRDESLACAARLHTLATEGKLEADIADALSLGAEGMAVVFEALMRIS